MELKCSIHGGRSGWGKTLNLSSRSASDNIRTIIEKKTGSVYVQKFHRLINGTSSSGKRWNQATKYAETKRVQGTGSEIHAV